MREETSIKSRWRSICISKRSSGLQSVPADAPFAIITQTVPHNWISKHTGGTCRLPISCSSIIFFLDMSNTTRETHFEYASANALVQSLTLHMCVTTKMDLFTSWPHITWGTRVIPSCGGCVLLVSHKQSASPSQLLLCG